MSSELVRGFATGTEVLFAYINYGFYIGEYTGVTVGQRRVMQQMNSHTFALTCFFFCSSGFPAFAVELDGVLYDAIQVKTPSAAKGVKPVGCPKILNVTPDTKVESVAIESAETKAAWDDWHRRVALQVFARYSSMVAAEFKDSKPLFAQASYLVAKDNQIVEARIVHSSGNVRFDTLVVTAINSLNGNSILKFPVDAPPNSVKKSATFTMNAGMRGDFGPRPAELKSQPVQKELAQ